jgi:polyferredoxin
MKKVTASAIQRSRVASQTAFTVLFLVALVMAGMPGSPSSGLINLFFYTDPLILLTSLLATRTLKLILLLSLIPLVATVLLGRFYCGWVCPLGAINHLFSFLAIRFGRIKAAAARPGYGVKYVLLVLVLVLATAGTQIGNLLDPFSILTRSAAVAVLPAIGNAIPAAAPWKVDVPAASGDPVAPSPAITGGFGAEFPLRALAQAEVIGVVFLALLLLNFHRRRFYCHYVCPLGALYGLVSRFRLLHLIPSAKCIDCGKCEESCAYDGDSHDQYSKQDCLLCFNCARGCPEEGVNLTLGKAPAIGGAPINIGRRQVLSSVGSGILLSALPGLSSGAKPKTHGFVRPPGSLAEGDFLERCIRCGECVQACPTNFIQMAGLEAGVEAVWTPVANARTGYCDYRCTSCTGVCPSGAIAALAAEEKKLFKIGSAVVDKNRCFTHADGFNCTVCADRCPVPGAIRFRKASAWNFQGRSVTVNQIYVDPDLCNGCGVCEYVCPRTDAPGIVLTSDDEQRERGFLSD